MKIAPVLAALRADHPRIAQILVHTGQHYDDAMSQVFLEELGVGEPDHLLGVGSGSHAVQTARLMERLEPVLERERPDVMLVPGDVNSTLAATLVATKIGIQVGHIEAGLRSFDRTMPEEINRVVTDSLSDLLFIHSPEARTHLLREGCESQRIHFVGNTMIDTLVSMLPRIRARDVPSAYALEPGDYVVVTLHRPALVDGPLLEDALDALDHVATLLPVIFPVHPRTRQSIESLGWSPASPGLRLVEPLGYLDFVGLVEHAAAVVTDSGGIQEETTYLGIPCFTLRDNTERPVTCTHGTNVLLGLAPDRIVEVPEHLGRQSVRRYPPAGWDGAAAGRLAAVLAQGLPEPRGSNGRAPSSKPATDRDARAQTPPCAA